jgi:myo-inositol 2-dehydrogenase/D-chiro-inositol 1-dehydrogenase
VTRTRVGLIGCGALASAVHLRLLRRSPRARVVAVADPSPEARERARRIAPVDVTADAAELLARADLDSVVVCAPSHLHAELAVAVIEAGRDLYLEKPLATRAEDAAAVVAAAERAGVVGAIGFNRRFHPLLERARRLVREGALGEVRAVRTAFCEPEGALPEWKRSRATGGGVLLDLASHHLDLVPWLVGRRIEAVEARTRSHESEEDEARVTVLLERELEAECLFSFRTARCDSIELLGERGVLRVDRYAPALEVTVGRRRRRLPPSPALLEWRARRLVRPADDPSYRRALSAWLDAVRGGPNRCPTLADGLRSLEWVLAAQDSALVLP